MTDTAKLDYRQMIYSLTDKVQDEKTLRRVWKILDRQYEIEPGMNASETADAERYRDGTLSLLRRIDDENKLKMIYGIVHSLFLRS